MIRIGDYNTLNVARSTSVGLFLDDGAGTEILLPNKYVPEGIKRNEPIKVFCYLDHDERPIATTLNPFVIRDGFAFLKVAEVNTIGAFLNWGLEKQLLVPFGEQQTRMELGLSYVIHCYLDEKTFRLVGSAKIDKFIKKKEANYQINEEVQLLIGRKTDLGWEAIINNTHKGLLFFSDVLWPIAIGDAFAGFIKIIREDGKIDLSMAPTGAKLLDISARKVLGALTSAGGFLALHDKSSPEEVRDKLRMSKKSFKKGIGILYKQRKIELSDSGIRLKT